MQVQIFLTDAVPDSDGTFINQYEEITKDKKNVTLVCCCDSKLLFFLRKAKYERINLYFPFELDYSFLKQILNLGLTLTLNCSPEYFKYEMESFNIVYLKVSNKNELFRMARILRLKIAQNRNYQQLLKYTSTDAEYPLKLFIPPIDIIQRHCADEEFLSYCLAYMNLLKHGMESAKPFLNETIRDKHPKIKSCEKIRLSHPEAICIVQDVELLKQISCVMNCMSYNAFLEQRLKHEIFRTIILVDIPFTPIFRIYGANVCFCLITEPELTEVDLKLRNKEFLSKLNGKTKILSGGKCKDQGDFNLLLHHKRSSSRSSSVKNVLAGTSTKQEHEASDSNSLSVIKKDSNSQQENHRKLIKANIQTPSRSMISKLSSETPIKSRKGKNIILSQTPIEKENLKIPKEECELLEYEASCSDKKTDTSFSNISDTQDREFIDKASPQHLESSDLKIYRPEFSPLHYNPPKFKPILVTDEEDIDDSVGSLDQFVIDQIQFSSDYL
eukprot:NODE_29_length_37665_cov_1.081563.p8 type:complete len:500 gc:universal NODE_29_length_37665_cov_1.081563:25898-27397(+)